MTLDLLTEEQWLNFFLQYKGLPGQKEGLLNLRKQVLAAKAGILASDNEWIAEYRNNPEPQKPETPGLFPVKGLKYFRQTDSKLRGERDSSAADEMCASSSAAMFCNCFRPGLFPLPNGDDDYLTLLRSNGGITTNPKDHIRLMAKLGIKAEFVTNAGWDDLEEQSHKDRPVMVGWYHNGPASNPRRDGGHWSVVGDVSKTHVLMFDPNGEADLVNGGYLPNLNGEALLYSRKNWGPRWLADGPNTGWAIMFTG